MSDARGPSGRGGPHAFVASMEAPELAEEDRHHLERSLRLRDGDPLTVSDGAGRWRPCRFGSALEPTGEIRVVPRPSPALTVGFVVVKGGRPDLVVQKLTELGIDRIVPLHSARSVVHWNDQRAPRNQARLHRIAREAAMQSRRVWLPDVAEVGSVSQAFAGPTVHAEPGGRELRSSDVTVLVGPEGGWAPEELAGQDLVGLGDTVLRAETAAIAAATLMVAHRRGTFR